jgi:hypothetical protein
MDCSISGSNAWLGWPKPATVRIISALAALRSLLAV